MPSISLRKKPLIALRLVDERLSIVIVEDLKTGTTLRSSFSIVVTEELLAKPEALGFQLRRLLENVKAGGGRAIFCVPAAWCLSHRVEMPLLSDEDAADFLATEAERTLPLPLNDLVYTTSVFDSIDAGTGAAIFALPNTRLQWIHALIASAGLTPRAILPDVVGYMNHGDAGVRLIVIASGHEVEVAMTLDNALYLLRSLGPGTQDAAALARNLNLTISRLPQALQTAVTSATLYAESSIATTLADAFAFTAPQIEWQVRPLEASSEIGADKALFAAVLWHLKRPLAHLNFLTHTVQPFQAFLRQIRQQRVATLLGVTAGIIFIVMVSLFWQSHKLQSLESQRADLGVRAERLRGLQAKISAYRSWFEDEPETLEAMKQLATVFPRDGSVTLRSLRIRDRFQVTCAGNAASNAAWLTVLETMRSTKSIEGLSVGSVRGEAPVDFTFTYRVRTGPRDES